MVKRVRPLSGLDALFVYLETLGTPMHVASIMRLRPPRRAGSGYPQRLRTHLIECLRTLPVLQRVLVEAPFASGHPLWEDRPDIDIGSHVELRRLRAPGSEAQLDGLVARLHAEPLDRGRPLWRIVVIEGLADGGCALYLQSHHALVDGQAGLQLTRALLDVAPRRPLTGVRRAGPAAATPVARGTAAALAASASHFRRLLGKLPAQLQQAGGLGSAGDWLRAIRASLRLAPRTPFNGQIGQDRRFASGSLPLPELRAVARASGASLNEVLMALVGGALRHHLQRIDALPAASLLAAMPVSLRNPGEEGGNAVSMTQCTLATDLADPLQRLQAVQRDSCAAKARTSTLRGVLPTDFPGLGAPLLAGALGGLWRRARLSDRLPPLANLVISNVPGPPAPLYVADAAIRAFHPVSIVTHGLGLNVTVLSYGDALEVGIVSTPETLPQPSRLLQGMQRELRAIQAALTTRAAA